MDGTADVAIVGAGVIGLSVARELRRAGVERVVILEREPSVGRGSSSRANGGVRAQFSTRVNVEFSRFSIGELERLEAETGLLALHHVGYLLVTGTETGERSLRAGWQLQRSVGVPTEWLDPDAVMARAPFLRPDGLRAGTFHARDGFLDPHGLVTALHREARQLGATVRTGCGVTRVGRHPAGAFVLEHADGTLRAGWVINAAGADAAALSEPLGLDLPVMPYRRNLAYARDPLGSDELIPMCVDLDTGVLVRRERGGGYVIAYSDPDDPPSGETTLDPRFLEQVAQRIGNRFPHLAEVPIDPAQCWAGLYPETPDHHAVIGETSEVPRFVQCAGFGGHGLMHAPAAGRAVAEIVTQGRCTTFDLHPLRPSRFVEGDLVVETAVL